MAVISAWDSKEVKAVIFALKGANTELRRVIYKRTREKILPEWRDALADQISQGRYDALGYALIMKSTRVEVGTENIALWASTSTKKVTRGGLVPARDYYMYEYGGTPHKGEVKGRRGNTTYYYTRMLGTGLPPRTKYGRGAQKAGNKIGMRAVALWIESVVQIYNDAFRGRAL
jgi:hypothetical protein